MAERLNAHDSKSCDAGMYPRVQIPLSAPKHGFMQVLLHKTVFLVDENKEKLEFEILSKGYKQLNYFLFCSII